MYVKRIYMVFDGSDINEKVVWMWFEERECYCVWIILLGLMRMLLFGMYFVKWLNVFCFSFLD